MKKIWKNVKKDLWIVLLDIVAVNAAYFLALLLRFYVNNEFRPTVSYYLTDWVKFTPFYTVLCIVAFAIFRLYGGMWRYAGLNDMNRIIASSVVTTILQVVGTALFIRRMPITYYIIGGILQFLFVALIRFAYRLLLVEKKKVTGRKSPAVPAMIIGAGETARKAIRHLDDTPFRPVVAVDEQSDGQMLDGIPVVADYASSLSAVRAVFIADPHLSAEKRKEIKQKTEAAGIELQDYTGYLSNLGGNIPLSTLLSIAQGTVTLTVDGKTVQYASGEEALSSLKGRYDVAAIDNPSVTLRRPSSAAYVGYEAWARQHKEETGEDVSFF